MKIWEKIKDRVGYAEKLDPTPVALPVGMKKPESIAEMVQRLVRSSELRRYAESKGAETFEEAEDFDVGDDIDPSTPYELEFDPYLNKEVPKAEKQFMDANRKQFDDYVKTQRKKPKSKASPSPAAPAPIASDAEGL